MGYDGIVFMRLERRRGEEFTLGVTIQYVDEFGPVVKGFRLSLTSQHYSQLKSLSIIIT